MQIFKEKVLACLKASKFEDAIKLKTEFPVSILPSDIDPIIKKIVGEMESDPPPSNGEILSLSRRVKALEAFRDYGPNAKKMISTTELAEGYCGKILIVTIQNGVFTELVCLRSGDLWHREILKNTEAELKDLGFFSSTVFEMGGAYVRFEDDKSITIYKTSDDFGSCDKHLAAKLIKEKFPNRKINITN